jgi:outer membrane protein TolC
MFKAGSAPRQCGSRLLNPGKIVCRTNRFIALLFPFALMAPVSAVRGWSQQISSTSGEMLRLDQAIALALHDNPSVRQAELEAGKSEDRVAALRTNRYPSLFAFSLAQEQFVKANVDTTTTQQQTVFPAVGPFFSIPVIRRPTFIFAGLIAQPLAQQYNIALNIRQAEVARDTAREQLRLAKQSAIDSVRLTYYEILQTQSALESTQASITSYRELDRLTTDRVAQQVSLKSASLDVKTRLARAEYEAINLSNELATKKEQLNRILGRDIRVEFAVNPAPSADGFPADLESARNRALDQRPEVREARLNLRQAELDRRIKKSEYIPDVTAGFLYLTFRNFDESVPKNLASAGLGVKWEVYDWGRKRRQLDERDKAIEQAKVRLRDTENGVLTDVSDKFRKLQQTRQALVVAQFGEETARESLRVNMNRYQATAALLSDVLQSQSTLAEANHQFQQALLNYWTARSEFERALGEDN